MHAAGVCYRLDDAHQQANTCSQPRYSNGSCLPNCTEAYPTTCPSKLPPYIHACSRLFLISEFITNRLRVLLIASNAFTAGRWLVAIKTGGTTCWLTMQSGSFPCILAILIQELWCTVEHQGFLLHRSRSTAGTETKTLLLH